MIFTRSSSQSTPRSFSRPAPLSRSLGAFSMIELMTYVSLITISLTLLLSFEVMTQKSVSEQRLSHEIATQTDSVFQRLHSDVTLARAIQLRPAGSGLEIQLSGGDRVVWSLETLEGAQGLKCLTRRWIKGSGGSDVVRSFKRVIEFRFRISEGPRPLVTLETKVLLERKSPNPEDIVTVPFAWSVRTVTSVLR